MTWKSFLKPRTALFLAGAILAVSLLMVPLPLLDALVSQFGHPGDTIAFAYAGTANVKVDVDRQAGTATIVVSDSNGVIRVEVFHMAPPRGSASFDFPCETTVKIPFPAPSINDWQTSSHFVNVYDCEDEGAFDSA